MRRIYVCEYQRTRPIDFARPRELRTAGLADDPAQPQGCRSCEISDRSRNLDAVRMLWRPSCMTQRFSRQEAIKPGRVSPQFILKVACGLLLVSLLCQWMRSRR